MDNKTFNTCMTMMEEHFGKKLKEPRFYWEELKQLPSDAFETICKTKIKQYAPTPGHFPTIQVLLEDFQGWLKSHPHRQEVIKWEYCPYCESHSPGLILVKKELKEQIYTNQEHNYRSTIVRCGHCVNAEYRNPTWPKYKQEEIEGRGWTIITKRHEPMDEKDVRVSHGTDDCPRSKRVRADGFTHIEHSLPTMDRDQDSNDDIPF